MAARAASAIRGAAASTVRPGRAHWRAGHGDEILVSALLEALPESAAEFVFNDGREVELKCSSAPT
jgi:hypothetical protein